MVSDFVLVSVDKTNVTIDWSGRGMPKVFKQVGRVMSEEERIRRAYTALPAYMDSYSVSMKSLAKAKKDAEKLDTVKNPLDWSVSGKLPYQLSLGGTGTKVSNAVKQHSYETIDWSTQGLPREVNTLFHRELYFDWSDTGMPSQYQKQFKRSSDFYKDYTTSQYDESGELHVDWSASNEMPWQIKKLTKTTDHDTLM